MRGWEWERHAEMLANFGAAKSCCQCVRDEKLGQVKVNPGWLLGMLQCCQLFALHCSFPHSPSPIPLQPVALVFPTFSTVSQFSHTKKPKTQTSKQKQNQKPEVGSTPFNLRTSSQPSVTISCPDCEPPAASASTPSSTPTATAAAK